MGGKDCFGVGGCVEGDFGVYWFVNLVGLYGVDFFGYVGGVKV